MKLTIAALLLIAASSSAWGRSAGAPQGVSGAPGDGLCTNCHAGTANSGPGKVTVTFANPTYTPGQTQKVTVTITDPNAMRWGFEASPRLSSAASTTGAGTLAKLDDNNTQLNGTDGTRQWITHTAAGTRQGTRESVTFEFNWTAPETAVGDVDFYVAANAANGNQTNQGDSIYTTKATISAAGAGPGQRPSISEGGVTNGASFRAGAAPGSWITIKGQNLSTTTREWRGDEIVNGNLPTSLDGVSVTVNGKPAAVAYISPTQINAQAPDDTSTGSIAVVVKNAAGESTPSNTTLSQLFPGFFMFSPQESKYVAAVSSTGANLGPAGLFGGSVTTRPARPGETILLFGTGFGPTNPTVPAGKSFSGAAQCTNTPVITIGGMNANVAFAGLSGTGLYQFNVTVPALATGDHAVVATIGGVTSQTGAMLAVAP